MEYLSVALALAAFVTGLKAAWDWYRSSKVEIVPRWEAGEPVDPLLMGTLDALARSAALNKKAALWTAITVVLGTIAGVLSSFN